ncbi:alpha/beta fold hydrolase [Pseudoxanthomonas sp.]|uniref:alpha/beta hydrolase family protein n=1 Tax=Pseudoxanthomonas sp. TaxID=1871049 RepID=UPI002615DD45|nr:alpha/beta fold hydrolase [Pseudoxanthomonas sp.]WDS36418.1 MAG: alpha/beta fold hydrolase [Pseudoxanthomonas sp.]
MTSPAEVGELQLQATDGHAWTLLHRIPERPRASLLWLPALGVAARHYLPFAEALQTLGIAVFLHEARGHGSSSWRASRSCNWGYRELLELDLPVSLQAMQRALEVPHRIVGGHSLGGQLAACLAALAPSQLNALWLVASGTPDWRRFPAPRGLLLPLAYRFMGWLARRNGTLPGRRIGFGGNEARGLINDWSRVGLSGRYAGQGMRTDLEQALSQLSLPVNSVVLTQDWFAPTTSLAGLTDKFAVTTEPATLLDSDTLGAKADHFAWMQRPQRVAEALAARLR